MSRFLDDVEDFLEMQGLKRDSQEFERALIREKVNRCMLVQGVASCTECARFTDCDLRLAYWRDRTLGPEYAHEVDEDAVGSSGGDLPEE